MRLNKSFYIFLLILIPVFSYSQSALLKTGESGVGIGGGVTRLKEVHSRQGFLTASFSGYADIGYYWGSVRTKNNINDGNFSGFFGRLHIVRSKDSTHSNPINVMLFAEFENVESQSATTVGLTVYKRQKSTNKSFSLPGISISRTSFEGGLDAVWSYYVEIPIGVRMSNDAVFNITPLFGVADKKSLFGISAGFTLVINPMIK